MISGKLRKLYCPRCGEVRGDIGEVDDVLFILRDMPEGGQRLHTRCLFHANEIEGERFTTAEWEERKAAMRVMRVMATLSFREAEEVREKAMAVLGRRKS